MTDVCLWTSQKENIPLAFHGHLPCLLSTFDWEAVHSICSRLHLTAATERHAQPTDKITKLWLYSLVIDTAVYHSRISAIPNIKHLWTIVSCLLLWHCSWVQHSDLNTYILIVAQKSNMLALKTIHRKIEIKTLCAQKMGLIHYQHMWLVN